MKKLNGLFCLCVIFIFFGCQKNVEIEKNILPDSWVKKIKTSLKNNTKSQKTGDDLNGGNFSNPKNPYEWVGIEHNNCLDFVGQYAGNILDNNSGLVLSIKEPFNDQIFTTSYTGKVDKIKAISQKYWNENVIPNRPSSYFQNADKKLTNQQQAVICSDNFNWFNQNKYLDPITAGLTLYKANINQKLSYFSDNNTITIEELEADSTIISHIFNSSSLDEAIDVIKQAESIIILSTDINKDVKIRQLIFLSIYRNSIGYWANAVKITNHPLIAINSQYFGKPYPEWSWKRFWRGLAVACADALGGVAVGAFTANPALIGLGGAVCSAATEALIP
jgi:hypothetical protein